MTKDLVATLGNLNEDFRSGFVSLIGPANAGKSTLLNYIIGEKVSIVSPKEQTTRDRILAVKTTEDAQIVFLDTPGFMSKRYRGALARKLSESLREAAAEVDQGVLLIDGARAVEDSGTIERLKKSVSGKGVRVPNIIAINKVDLIEKERLLPLLAQLDEEFRRAVTELHLVPLSAKTGEGVSTLLTLLRESLPKGPPFFPEDMHTDQPERFLAAEIVREKLFHQLNQELPYSVAVRIESWREEQKRLFINAVILVERDSQKGIVVGAKGAKIKSVGTSARLELQHVFDTSVHLELHVKVEKDWSKSEKGMRRAGYNQNSSYPT